MRGRSPLPRIIFPMIVAFALLAIPVWAADEKKPQKAFSHAGDFRLRAENDSNRDDLPDRNRQRFRFRLSGKWQPNDEFTVGARVVTGDSDDPNSSHQTLGNALDSEEISLDRAYFTYHPRWGHGLWVTGGKFGHPFRRQPVYGELVWDADVQPEGITVGWNHSLGDGVFRQIQLAALESVLIEQGNADEASLSAGQIAVDVGFDERVTASLAAGYHRYSNIVPDGNLSLVDDNAGNAELGGVFASEFGIFNGFISVTFPQDRSSLSLTGEYFENTRADIRDDSGYAFGARYKINRERIGWQFWYQYQLVEQDAVFSPFSQDDFMAQTNFRGHLAGIQFRFHKNMNLHLWTLIHSRDTLGMTPTTDSDQSQVRTRLDFNTRF